MRKRWLLAGSLITTATLIGGASAAVGHPTPAAKFTTVISGLNNPRGITLDSSGALYVAQAGAYGGTHSTPPPVEQGVTTGSVSKWVLRSHKAPKMKWSTPFTGLYTNERGIPEVIGPSGLSSLSNECEAEGLGRPACAVSMIMGESTPGFLAATGAPSAPPGLGELFRLNRRTGAATGASDVGSQQYAWTDANKSLWEEFPDSNPYGVLVTRDHKTGKVRTFVADAGANTISEIDSHGTAHVIAFIPNDGVRDSTPTCIAQGPDGALYTGTLNLFKNGFGPPIPGTGPGNSDVWRVDPDTHADFLHAATKWATGLTTVTACTFDRHGNFWATEMFANDVVKIPFSHPTSLTRYGSAADTPTPGGIAVGKNGSIYITINSLTFVPNSGAVVRLNLRYDD